MKTAQIYTETITFADGGGAVCTTTGSPRQRARRDHLCRLLGVQFPPVVDDYGTAASWEAMRASHYAADDRRAAERMGF